MQAFFVWILRIIFGCFFVCLNWSWEFSSVLSSLVFFVFFFLKLGQTACILLFEIVLHLCLLSQENMSRLVRDLSEDISRLKLSWLRSWQHECAMLMWEYSYVRCCLPVFIHISFRLTGRSLSAWMCFSFPVCVVLQLRRQIHVCVWEGRR